MDEKKPEVTPAFAEVLRIVEKKNHDQEEALRLFSKYPGIVEVLHDVEKYQAGAKSEKDVLAMSRLALKQDVPGTTTTKEVAGKKTHIRTLRRINKDGDAVVDEEERDCVGDTCVVCHPFSACEECGQDTYRGWCQNCQAGGSAMREGEVGANDFNPPDVAGGYHLDEHTEAPSTRTTCEPDRLVLVGLAGFQGSGKDTAASFLVEERGFQRVAFADALKEAAGPLFGFTEAQLRGTQAEKAALDPFWGFSARWAMQRFGTEGMRRVFGHDFWMRVLRRRLPKTGLVVVTDVRFENEAEMIRELGGEVWLVDRSPKRSWWQRAVDRACDLLGLTHASERLPRRLDLFDRVIDNRGNLGHLRDGVLEAFSEMVAR